MCTHYKNANLLICLHSISLEVNMVFSSRTSLCLFQIKSDFKKLLCAFQIVWGAPFLYKIVITYLSRYLDLFSAWSWEFDKPLFLTIWFIFQILIEFHYICLCFYHLKTVWAVQGIFPDSNFFFFFTKLRQRSTSLFLIWKYFTFFLIVLVCNHLKNM